ncbi:MAG: hypothetical protein AB7O67_21040 [Vicinamibacterales bacterium]
MAARGAIGTAGLLILIAFGGAFGLGRFYDDWALAAAAQHAIDTRATAAFILGPFDQHWAPGWWAFEILNERLAGWRSDVLIRGAIAGLVFAQALLVGAVARRLGAGRAAQVTAMAVVVLHPVSAAAFYSLDTYAQVLVNLLAWAALSGVLLAVLASPRAHRVTRRVGLALVLMGAGLVFKEQALTVGAGMGALTLWVWVAMPGERAAARPLALGTAGAVLIAMAFTAMRARMGLWMDPGGPYAVCLTCAPGNVGLLTGGVLLPMQTLDLYLALREPGTRLPALVAGGLGMAAVASMLVAGLIRARERGAPVVPLVLLCLSATFPVLVLAHVGELYANSLVFWAGLLAACAVEGWRARLETCPARTRHLAAGWLVLALVSLAVNQQLNLGEMRRTGLRAAGWVARFERALAEVPAGSAVLVRGLDDLKGPADYSLYRLTTPSLLLRGPVAIQLARRDLVLLDALDAESLAYWRARAGSQARLFVADVLPGRIRVGEAAPPPTAGIPAVAR